MSWNGQNVQKNENNLFKTTMFESFKNDKTKSYSIKSSTKT